AVVINARMSPRSFKRLKRVAGLARRMLFRHVEAFGAQSAEYAERLRQLGVAAERVAVTGSVKYDGATGERDTPKGRELRRVLLSGGREPPERTGTQGAHAPRSASQIVWVAGSTHAPEEAIVL